MFTLWLPLGFTSSSVCVAVVAHVPIKHVHFCSDKCAFVVYFAGGVRRLC